MTSPMPPSEIPNSSKNFVLDTNVLLHDPNAIFKFDDNTVIIPIFVIEEIDQFKKDLSDLGRNARQISRTLDSHRTRGNLGDGVLMDNGGTLRVAMPHAGRATFEHHDITTDVLDRHLADNLIMAVALDIQAADPNTTTIFVTKDTNLRVRADALGLNAENYEANSVKLDDLYPGAAELDVTPEFIASLFEHAEASIDDLLPFLPPPPDDSPIAHPSDEPQRPDFFPNEYLLLRGGAGQNALARVDPSRNSIRTLRRFKEGVWGIRPRNKEQHFALDCLMDESIQLVTLLGKAGTGKTLIAIAAGLQKCIEEKKYHKLLVSRPIFPLGRDIGYLPGDVEEKLNPWMQPIFDNIEFLMGLTETDRRSGRSYREFIDMGMLQIEPLTYIRGRSIPQQYMIVDECQNLTPHEVKTILTRAGEGTKIILTGDPYQIDNPYVDAQSNGLTYVVNRFKGQSIAASVTLTKGERSKLAELSANLL
jgi:PhoH-like ATPase